MTYQPPTIETFAEEEFSLVMSAMFPALGV